jgi:hypothetical protein
MEPTGTEELNIYKRELLDVVMAKQRRQIKESECRHAAKTTTELQEQQEENAEKEQLETIEKLYSDKQKLESALRDTRENNDSLLQKCETMKDVFCAVRVKLKKQIVVQEIQIQEQEVRIQEREKRIQEQRKLIQEQETLLDSARLEKTKLVVAAAVTGAVAVVAAAGWWFFS